MTEQLHLDGEAEQRGLDWRLLRRLGEFLRPHLWWVLAGLGIAIATSAITPVRPYLSKIAVDEYLLVGKWSGFVGMLAAIGGVVLLTAALQYGRTYLLQWIGQRVLFEIRLRLYEHVQRLAIAFFDRTPVGRLVTRVTNDVEGLSELLSSGLVLLIADVLLLFWIVGFMLATEWRLALLTLSVMPILIAASIVFRIKVRRAYRLLRQQLARLNGFLSEYIGGIATTQLFGQQDRQFARFERLNRRYRDLYHRVVFYYAVFFPTVDLVWALAIVLILWYAAGALGHSLSVGTLLAFMQYVEMFFRPIRDLTERYNTLQSGLVAAERIFGLLQVQQFIEDRPDAQPMPPLQRGIEFRNVSFSYDGRTPVLRNVSFFVGKGEIVAIVGATGRAKVLWQHFCAGCMNRSRAISSLMGAAFAALRSRVCGSASRWCCSRMCCCRARWRRTSPLGARASPARALRRRCSGWGYSPSSSGCHRGWIRGWESAVSTFLQGSVS